jgi:hypothetical protein
MSYDDGFSLDADATEPSAEIPDSDVDGPAAKKHGDYFVQVGEPARALCYYQEALNKGDLDAETTARVHYNMANCHYNLGDQTNCYASAYEAAKGLGLDNQVFALRLFFWGATGETIAGMG